MYIVVMNLFIKQSYRASNAYFCLRARFPIKKLNLTLFTSWEIYIDLTLENQLQGKFKYGFVRSLQLSRL